MDCGFKRIYMIDPIDYGFDLAIEYEKFIKNIHTSEDRENLLKISRAIVYFVDVLRESICGIWIFAMPNPGSNSFELSVAIKADNNGTTYIFTDVFMDYRNFELVREE